MFARDFAFGAVAAVAAALAFADRPAVQPSSPAPAAAPWLPAVQPAGPAPWAPAVQPAQPWPIVQPPAVQPGPLQRIGGAVLELADRAAARFL